MDRSEEIFFKRYYHSSLLLERQLSIESNIIDNYVAQLGLQSTKLEYIEPNDINIHVLWLTNDNDKQFISLNGINIRIFQSNDNLIDFISELKTSNVFLIIDYNLTSNILSSLDNFSQIIFIYVLKNEENKDNLLLTDSKRSIRKISDNKDELFRLINEDIDTCTKDLICTTIFDLTTIEESTNQTENISFIWYYLLIESLFDLTVYNKTAKDDLIKYCRQQYSIDNKSQQNFITKFENEYSSENAIQWYTRDSFIYRQLNKALRMRDIDSIFKFRFFIIDFQKQLQLYYNEQKIYLFKTVYRGQTITQEELIKLKNSVGKYISFNTYLSTSTDKMIALMYATGPLSILLEFDINVTPNLKNKRIRPVYIQDKSDFPEELEVIFPIGSTFLVDSIEMKDNQWNIKLILTDNNHTDKIIDMIKTIYLKNIPPKLKFTELIVSLGDYENAERYIEMLFEDLQSSSDYTDIGYVYYLMGQIQYEKCNYQYALSYFDKALENIKSENIHRVEIYRNLGILYRDKNDYENALKYLNEALKFKQDLDILKLADLYDNFGNLYRLMGNFDNALIYLNQALELRQSNESTKYTSWTTEFSLALIYKEKSDHTQALEKLKCALNISSKILPKNHPTIIFLYAFTGFMYFQLKDLSLTLIYLEKALNLIKTIEQKQNVNPVIHIFICNAFVKLYKSKEDVINRLHYAQEVFKIYNQFENILLKNNYSKILIIYNLANAYYDCYDYNSALEFFFKTLELSNSNNDRMEILKQIGQTYLRQDDREMALHYLNESCQLYSKVNQSDHNIDLFFWNNYNICKIYQDENKLDKSIFFLKKALQLQLDRLNTNFDDVLECYTLLMKLCPEQKKSYVNELHQLLQNDNLSISSRNSCHFTLGCYYKLQNNFSYALNHFQSSLKYELSINPPSYYTLIYIYSFIGQIYKRMEGTDSDTALSYYQKSLDIYLKYSNLSGIPQADKKHTYAAERYSVENIIQCSGLTDIITSVYHDIAEYYIQKENYEQALDHLQIMDKILNQYKGKNELTRQDITYRLMAFAYESMQHYDKAIFYYENSLKYISNDDYNEYVNTYCSIALVYFYKKEYLISIKNCEIALTLLHNTPSINHKKLADTYSLAAASYKKMENNKYCYIYSQQAIEYSLLCNPINYDELLGYYIFAITSLFLLRPWDTDKPLKDLLIALKYRQYYSKDSLRRLYLLISRYCYHNQEYKKSLLYNNKTLDYSTESDDIIEIYRQQFLNYMFIGEFDKAYDIIKKSINYQFNLTNINFIKISDSYIDMGCICYEHGKYKLALKCYRSSFYILEIYQNDRKHDNYARIYNYMACIHLAQGQIIKAHKLCSKARDIHISNKDNRLLTMSINITFGLIECKLENYYSALDYFGKSWEFIFNENLRNNHWLRILYNHIGYVYFKLGQIEIAMKNYFKSLSLYNDCKKHPYRGEVYKNIGLIYEQNKKNYPVALSYYKRALKKIENNKHPYYITYQYMINTLKKNMSLFDISKSFVFSGFW